MNLIRTILCSVTDEVIFMLQLTDYQREIIGYGLKYPDCFNSPSGSTQINGGLERINQSIYLILSTKVGTRFFLPEFGSMLHELVFEPNDVLFRDLARLYVLQALHNWEPRINNIEVDVKIIEKENTVPISIRYNLINTNVVGNYIYPFNRQIYEISSYTPPPAFSGAR